jgi:hypothetical protein
MAPKANEIITNSASRDKLEAAERIEIGRNGVKTLRASVANILRGS